MFLKKKINLGNRRINMKTIYPFNSLIKYVFIMLTDPDKFNSHQLNRAIILEEYIQMFTHFLILNEPGHMMLINCDIYHIILLGFHFFKEW